MVITSPEFETVTRMTRLEREAWQRQERERKNQRPRLRPIPFGEITLGKAPRYLVKGWIPAEGLVIVWGPPKCGKSFFAFDLAGACRAWLELPGI